MSGGGLSEEERRFVAECGVIFDSLTGPTILYGVGVKSRLLIEHLPRLEVVALLDASCMGARVYGRPVVTLEEAVALAPRQVIIAAGMAVNPTIFRRIEPLARDHGIPVFFINGQQAASPSNGIDTEVAGFGDILALATRHGLVSFDLFETLIERTHPIEAAGTVIAARVGSVCGLPVTVCEGVVTRRFTDGEALCRRHARLNPALAALYHAVLEDGGLPVDAALDFAAAEVEVERSLIRARSDVGDVFRKLRREGHRVCITSDTYHDAATIRLFLEECKLPSDVPVFSSSVLGRSKYDGSVWKIVEREAAGSTVLHVGDNASCDGVSARLAGITAVVVPSKSDIRKELGLLLQPVDGVGASRLAEVLCPFLENMSFSSSTSGSRLDVRTPFEAGFLFFGPLLLGYLQWLSMEACRLGASRVLFLSRDGFLLERLWNRFIQPHLGIPASLLLTSRRAASVPSIWSAADIRFVLERVAVDASLTVGDLLARAFGLDPAVAGVDAARRRLTWESEDDFREWFIERFGSSVYARAAQERIGIEACLASFEIAEAEQYLCVDLIARGTTQLLLEKLLPGQPSFCYLHTPRQWSDLATRACAWSDGHPTPPAVEVRQVVVEAVVGAPFGQVVSYTSSGVPLFEAEDRKFAPAELHEGVVAFCEAFLRRRSASPIGFVEADRWFSYLFSRRFALSETVRNAFSFRDYFSPQRGEWELDFSALNDRMCP